MQTVRIFVSSPRDVGSERALASRVIERLRFEFRGREQRSRHSLTSIPS